MKKINVTRSSLPPFSEYVEKIKPLWESRWLTNNGVLHQELEEKLAKVLDTNNVSLFNNGHLALYTALKALNLSGEVITTPFTFVSTTHAIVQNGLTLVFCDIDPVTLTIDPKKIEELITDKTSAIVAVHVYGNICDVTAIEKIAKKHNLRVIYDAAHAFLVKYKGKGIGNFGDISMFSLHATKVFHTIEGGALAYNDNNLKDKIASLRNFGFTSEEECEYVAMNTKMNEFQAAMGLCNLNYIDDWILARKKLVNLYKQTLKDVKGIRFLEEQKDVTYNYIYMPIIVEDDYGLTRDELKELLSKHNIFARKYFYPLTSEFICYKQNKSNTKIALDISKRVLTLPLYSDLKIDEVLQICDIIKNKKGV